MDKLEMLIRILEKSVEHNGEKPMTNKWMLNILKKAKSNLCSEVIVEGFTDPFFYKDD